MSFSTLFDLDSSQLTTEAEVETRLLSRIFHDLGYPDGAVMPKKHIKALKIHDGIKSAIKEVDFMLLDKDNIARIVVEAKDPSINILDAWGQAASYALSLNRDKKPDERVKWLLISNGHVTGLFPHDSETPVVTLQLSDFASGMPPYVALRTYIKYNAISPPLKTKLPFLPLSPQKLNQLFADSHTLVWKKEKMAPADAFFEFCKFIFIKIQEDKKREKLPLDTPPYMIPLTVEWLKAQSVTTNHPVRDVLFNNLHTQLETAIIKDKKKRIFGKDESLRLSAATCMDLIKSFQSINLSTIDEDLNGRMFEVFLASSIRGKDLGQFFTPRSVVDFMTRIALRNIDIKTPPRVLDACCGTAGFLIEVMAYLTGRLRDDTRLTDEERKAIKQIICNERLFGVEANERVARIARINMYLHGDGGSHVFHGDGLDSDSLEQPDMNAEQKDSMMEYKEKVTEGSFDIILTNPPFSMIYNAKKPDERRVMEQYELTLESTTIKSSILFLNRYYELLRPSGEMLIVLDDTVLNGKSFERERGWIREKFIILGVHSLPFNAFFKAKANIKTSIIHLRKKTLSTERQGHVFMSISNNVGHDNSLRDTPFRNNLTEILISYLEWQRTGSLTPTLRDNANPAENLECPLQYWLVVPDKITDERFDAFFYSPELYETYKRLNAASESGNIELLKGNKLVLRKKLTSAEKKDMRDDGRLYKYIEISDVTQYGLITSYAEDVFEALPTRGEYQVRAGDVLLALNNSSRGTVVLVPDEFDRAICTSGFLVIVPNTREDGLLLWYALRGESCKKQIYYLAQTASQPELKIDMWNEYFLIPLPSGPERMKALSKAQEFYGYVKKLSDINNYRSDF
ncbi:MAG: N-6 DNA methylase [Synergistaceae bacterium]|jgi:type I restriction enzyme M protein|nr:N-6 DNA methylase [Synergistaceae bacterium]